MLFGTFFRNVSFKSVCAASATAIVVHFAVYYGQITSYMQEPVNNPAIASTIAILSSLLVGVIVHFVEESRKVKTEDVY